MKLRDGFRHGPRRHKTLGRTAKPGDKNKGPRRMNAIRYTIVPKNPAAHLFEVTLTVAQPDPSGQRFVLPVWIPGSYMIREFARNIVTLQAFNAAGKKIAVEKTDKHAWVAAARRPDHAALRGVRLGHVGARGASRREHRLFQRIER